MSGNANFGARRLSSFFHDTLISYPSRGLPTGSSAVGGALLATRPAGLVVERLRGPKEKRPLSRFFLIAMRVIQLFGPAFQGTESKQAEAKQR